MEIKKMPPNTAEKTTPLKDVEPGGVIRFAETTFEEALEGEHPGFYTVIQAPANQPAEKVSLIPADGKGPTIIRDADRAVYVHEAKLLIGKVI